MSCVLIYSKNTLFRECLANIVRDTGNQFDVISVNNSAEFNQLIAVDRPDFVIADVYSRNFGDDIIPAMDGVVDPDRIILVTTLENKHLTYYYSKYNISHFVFAEQPINEITETVNSALCGCDGCSFNRHDTLLTPRECEILQLIATGKTSKEIADMLCISKNTVDTHRNKMLQKLNMANSASLVQFAYSSGLI